jgi:SAM-dependent methyltransferase
MILDSLVPDGNATDIGCALRAVRDRLRGEQIEGIVLVSDGANTLGGDPVAVSDGMGIPIYAVGIGDPMEARDIQVAGVFASEMAYVGKPVPVEVTIRSRGYKGMKAPVLLTEGKKRLDEQMITLRGDGLEQRVTLEMTPKKPGRHTFRIVLPVQEGELSEENNRRLFSVKVLESKVRILLVAGSPSADLSFLRRSWERNEDLHVKTVVLGQRKEAFRISDTDLVALLDVSWKALRNDAVQELVRAVREDGLGLLLIGGPHAFGAGGTVGNPLEKLLPWTMEKGLSSYREGAFSPRITPEGAHHPIPRLSEDPVVLLQRWGELPPLLACNGIAEAKSWARVLAVHPTLGNARGPMPLVAVGGRDRGKVMGVAFSTFWRWDLLMWGIGKTNEASERFWSNAVRWLVAREADAPVRISTDKPIYRAGEPIVFRGQVYDESYRPLPGGEVQVVFEEAARERVVFLEDEGSGRYEGRTAGLRPGEYAFRARASIAQRSIGEAEGAFTVGSYSLEFEHTGMNEELLRRIAHRSGGTFYTPDTFGAILKDVDLQKKQVSHVRKMRLWDWWGLFAGTIALLCAEWTIRRRWGMI